MCYIHPGSIHGPTRVNPGSLQGRSRVPTGSLPSPSQVHPGSIPGPSIFVLMQATQQNPLFFFYKHWNYICFTQYTTICELFH